MPPRRSPKPPCRGLADSPVLLKKSYSMGVDGTFLNGATIRLANRLNHQSMPKNVQDVVLERPREVGDDQPG